MREHSKRCPGGTPDTAIHRRHRRNLVAAAASTVEEAVGGEGIAGLVKNADIGEAWPLEVLRRQFEVKVFGHLVVTQAFLHLIIAATGRIVNVASVGGRTLCPSVAPSAPPGSRSSS